MTTECHDNSCKNRCSPINHVVLVKWKDASMQTGSTLFVEDLRPGIIVETAGTLVQETEDFYSIAGDYYPDNNSARNVSHIPKVNVISIKKFDRESKGGTS